MLEELAVRDLGVISELALDMGRGMTAVTGETGAGKTLVVGAIELLIGGRAEATLVRAGHYESRVDGRFSVGGDEVVVSRVVKAEGRSRGYIDGRPASATELGDLGARLVDLHGQNAHQALLSTAAQRAALDAFAGVDLEPLRSASAAVRSLEAELATLGGDRAAQARELEFCRFQLTEIDEAAIEDPDEDATLEAEEDRLADAVAHQEAAVGAYEALTSDAGASDALASALGLLRDRAPFADFEERGRIVAAELTELAADLRAMGEQMEPDPERLAWVRERRQRLRELARKYGVTTGAPAAAVLHYGEEVRARVDELEGLSERAAQVEDELVRAREVLAERAAAVGKARRKAAPGLGKATQAQLNQLAMPKARLTVEVGDTDPGDDVSFLLAANPGAPLQPLAKVASGGELARSMLALRLALLTGKGSTGDGASDTLIFDEVDAGIGGSAASAVGAALARLARDRQVFVVTHLPQVAAWADHQVSVSKVQSNDDTVSVARRLDGEERVIELARMLSGSPDSASAREHAAELLAEAASARA